MKKLLVGILVLAILFAFVGCGSSSNSYIIVDGQQQSIDYLFELNDLQKEEYSKKDIVIVGELEEVNGATRFSSIGEVDSYIVIKSSKGEIRVETSGMEDTVMDWAEGDLIEVEGKISWVMSNTLYLLDFYPSDNNITVKKIG